MCCVRLRSHSSAPARRTSKAEALEYSMRKKQGASLNDIPSACAKIATGASAAELHHFFIGFRNFRKFQVRCTAFGRTQIKRPWGLGQTQVQSGCDVHDCLRRVRAQKGVIQVQINMLNGGGKACTCISYSWYGNEKRVITAR